MSRAPVTLTREMKLLLTALGLVALLGGWLVYNSTHKADQTVVVPPPIVEKPVTPNKTTIPADSQEAGATSRTDPSTQGVNVVTADGKTEVATAPPFPMSGAAAEPAVVIPTPSGINPNEKLTSLGGYNPFRPSSAVTATASGMDGTLAGSTQPAGPVTVTQPSSTPQQIDSALDAGSAGALPQPSIAGTGSSSSVGALPQVTIPGTGTSGTGISGAGTSSVESPSTGTRVSTSRPGTTATNSGRTPGATANTGSTGSTNKATTPTVTTPTVPGRTTSNSTQNNQTATTARPGTPAGQSQANQSQANQTQAGVTTTPVSKPVTPTSVGSMAEPGLNIPGGVTGAAMGSAAGVPGATGGNAGGMLAGTNVTPQVLTDIAQPAPASITDSGNATPPAPAMTPVEAAVQEHQLVFDAAVLGPVNTAVFRSDKGYVVATAGQAIPNTNIVLKEVTATTATLAQGGTTTTLQLNKK